MNESPVSTPRFPLHSAIFEGMLSAVAVLAGWLLGEPALATMFINVSGVLYGLLAVLPLLLILILGIKYKLRIFTEVLSAVDRLVVPLFRQCTWFEMAGISLLAGLGEELLFRGVFQAALDHGLLQAFGERRATAAAWLAAALVALMFGLLHAVNRSYAILATLIGFYLGWLWFATGNLTAPIITHAVYDFLALAWLVKWRRRKGEGEEEETKHEEGNVQ